MKDSFSDLTRVQGCENLTQLRDYPRVVTRPDVRINPTTPDHYMHKGKACGYGWFPFILRTQQGALLCIMRECLEHVYDDSGGAVACRSTNGGRTWSMPIHLYKKDHYCPVNLR